MDTGPTVTDWITAVASVFAAIGTVGAVVVALRQVLRQEKRHVDVNVSRAIMMPDEGPLHVLIARATNVGFRPIKLTMAYLTTDDGQVIVSPFAPYSDALPAVLDDGESVEAIWKLRALDEAKGREGFSYYETAFFRDVLGNAYYGPHPDVEIKRKGNRRRTVFVRRAQTEDDS